MLAEEGKAKAIAFDEIDKAPEEKKRGITIATVGIAPPPHQFSACISYTKIPFFKHFNEHYV